MSDPIVPAELKARAIVEDGAIKVMSPSPTPGEPQAQRRREDTASYSAEWAVLIVALMTWAITFFGEISQVTTWSEIQTPAFVGTHVAQILGVVVSVVAAKRIK